MSYLQKTIKDILSLGQDVLDKEFTVKGWVKTLREQDKGKLLFIEVQDGTSLKHIQAVVFDNKFEESVYKSFFQIKTGYSIGVTGTFVKSPSAGQDFELVATKIEIYGDCGNDYLLQKHSSKTKGVTFDTLRSEPHIRCRAATFQSINRIRDRVMRETHNFFGGMDFVWASSPIITFSDCEGAGETFLVTTTYPKEELPNGHFFGQEAYLTVSGQLEGEMLATSMSRVYTFGPTFRAEKSKTTRHLSEFTMIEPEVAFIDLKGLISLAIDYVKHCVSKSLEHNIEDVKQTHIGSLQDSQPGTQLKDLYQQRGDCISKLKTYIEQPFQVISYNEAIDILLKEIETKQIKFSEKVEWGIDMCSEHERYLTDTFFKCPVVVHSYPANIKAFYMKRHTAETGDERCVQSFDLLVPGIGELIGGSIREHDYEKLCTVMKERKMEIERYKPYLDLRLYGTVPHGGFGLGFERLIRFVTGIDNIKDVVPFPRSF